jgi:hypothetical protein
MVVNFSHEELVLLKSTVLGVAEEVSPSMIAAINNQTDSNQSSNQEQRKQVYTVEQDERFQSYIHSVLEHLTPKDRAVMEPVLRAYRYVFHDDKCAKFEGTDLIEHRIITGDAPPLRKAPYRVPFALRDEMDRQVKDMLDKGVIEHGSSP